MRVPEQPDRNTQRRVQTMLRVPETVWPAHKGHRHVAGIVAAISAETPPNAVVAYYSVLSFGKREFLMKLMFLIFLT